ncbi:MAG: aminotransferase class III-fold pyridoxal phosphate-dependent enzyme [Myxococcales bacterium]
MALAKSALLDVFKTIAFEPVRGEGVWLFDKRGERYLDFYGGHAVALLGYAHPRLLEAASKQAAELFFQSNAVPLAVRERAAKALVGFGPKGLDKVFFVNSGAEANENALRIAFLATKRQRVVAVAGAFHGRTAAAGAITDHASWYAFPRRPFDVTTVAFDDVQALEQAVGDDVAAVIFEPVQGMAGARPLSLAFARAARRLTRKRGALLVFDEVQCGMGRSGQPFVAQAWGVTPDVLTTAKGVAGGYPVGAVMVGDALAKKISQGQLGTTFGGGPVACALVETVVREAKRLLGSVRRLSRRLMRECRVGPVIDVLGMGLLLGLRTSRPAAEILAALRAKRILAGGSADPNVVRLLPPLTLQDEHVDALVSALKEIRR